MFQFIPLVNRELDNHWYGHDCLVDVCKAERTNHVLNQIVES